MSGIAPISACHAIALRSRHSGVWGLPASVGGNVLMTLCTKLAAFMGAVGVVTARGARRCVRRAAAIEEYHPTAYTGRGEEREQWRAPQTPTST